MNKSYLSILFLLSVPLFAMEEKSEKEYAQHSLKGALSKINYLFQIKDKREKEKAWFNLLIEFGKIEACKDLDLFDSNETDYIEKATQEIKESFLSYLNSEKKSAFLMPLFFLGEEGILGNENKETFRDLHKKLEQDL